MCSVWVLITRHHLFDVQKRSLLEDDDLHPPLRSHCSPKSIGVTVRLLNLQRQDKASSKNSVKVHECASLYVSLYLPSRRKTLDESLFGDWLTWRHPCHYHLLHGNGDGISRRSQVMMRQAQHCQKKKKLAIFAAWIPECS